MWGDQGQNNNGWGGGYGGGFQNPYMGGGYGGFGGYGGGFQNPYMGGGYGGYGGFQNPYMGGGYGGFGGYGGMPMQNPYMGGGYGGFQNPYGPQMGRGFGGYGGFQNPYQQPDIDPRAVAADPQGFAQWQQGRQQTPSTQPLARQLPDAPNTTDSIPNPMTQQQGLGEAWKANPERFMPGAASNFRNRPFRGGFNPYTSEVAPNPGAPKDAVQAALQNGTYDPNGVYAQ